MPQQLKLTFGGTSSSGQDVRGEGLCQVADAAFACEVPAGRLDMKLRSPSFVSRFVWGVEVLQGKELRLGALELKPGASLFGWVEQEEGRSTGVTRIELAPQQAIAGAAIDPQMRLHTAIAEADERGFFHFDSLAPGYYDLRAARAGFVPQEVRGIRVSPRAETELTSPVLLRRPVRLVVHVDPPRPPGDEGWRMELLEPPRLVPTRAGQADAHGIWELDDLAPGLYQLAVRDPTGQAEEVQEVALDEARNEVWLEVKAGLEVRGTLTLGDEPLPAAEVRFGGRWGRSQVPFKTDAEGRFEGRLPRSGAWEVFIAADEPPVTTQLRVEVEPRPGTDWAEVDMELPNTSVSGRVLDDAGKPATTGLVNVTPIGTVVPTAQLSVSAEGRFRAHGLAQGTYGISAEAGRDWVSDTVPVSLAEDQEAAEIVLALRRRLLVKGQVISRDTGAPVPGARVIVRSTHVIELVPRITTDAQGRFEAVAPPGSTHAAVTIMALGYGMRTLLVAANGERHLLEVSSRAGTLLLSEVLPEREEEPRAYLLHGGWFVLPGLLAQWATDTGAVSTTSDLMVPAMEPGVYQLCLATRLDAVAWAATGGPPSRCSIGDLAAGSTLRLALPLADGSKTR